MADKEIILPKGVAIWPKLETPDTKFIPLGVYSVDIAVPLEEAESTMKELSEEFKAHTGKPPAKSDNTMWKMEIDEETGEETGKVIFKCKIKNVQRKNGDVWDRKPVLWDSKGNRIKDVNVGGGSILRLKCSVYCWVAGAKKGVSLQPMAVQVLDLKSFSKGESFDFEVEDGFEATPDNSNEFEDGEEYGEEESEF